MASEQRHIVLTLDTTSTKGHSGIRYQADGGAEKLVIYMDRLHSLLHVALQSEFRYAS